MDSTVTVSDTSGFEIGDTITFGGHYKKRTFWQWITRKPRELCKYNVTDMSGTDMTINQSVMDNEF